MALSVGTTARDAVGQRTYGADYSSLDSPQQANVDSALADALIHCEQTAEHFGLGASSAPDEWAPWFHALGAKLAAMSGRPERFANVSSVEEQARSMAMSTYDSLQTSGSNTYGSFTLEQVRVQVRRALVSLPNPVFASINDVDRVFEDVMSMIWHRAAWSFRERPVTATIATDETVSFSPALTPWSFQTRVLVHTDAFNDEIIQVDADTMAGLKSRGTDPGRPTRFRMHRDGDSGSNVIKYEFWPTPDVVYDVRAVIVVDGPPTITTVSNANDLDVFPRGIRPIMLDIIIGRLMAERRAPGGDRREANAMERLEHEVCRIDDLGEGPKRDMTPRDVRELGVLDGGASYGGGTGSYTFPNI